MRTVVMLGTGCLAVAVVVGCAGSPSQSAAGQSVSPSAVRPASAASCLAANLRWRAGGGVAAMTGEHAEMFYLANRGSAPCTVLGYPSAVLYGAGGAVLPFRFADGGGMYVTTSKPVPVALKPGASAYLVIAKYRCDLGIVSDAASVRLSLRLPGGGTLSRRLRLPVRGAPGLSYCTGGRHDPGQLVVISPLERSLRATGPAG